MKKTIILFVLFLIAVSSFLKAQTSYPSTGSYWNYEFYGHSGGYDEDVTIIVIQDTLINGFETKKLKKTSLVTYSFPPNPTTGTMYEYDFGIIQYRNDSVFYYPYAYPINEQFLYAFNMNIGDTIHFVFPSNLSAVVDTMYNIDVNGVNLKKWELTKYCNENAYENTSIIEKIGPINDYLLWNFDGCISGGGTHNFQCFSSTELNYNSPCYPLMLNLDEWSVNPFFEVHPNPSSGLFQISLPKTLPKFNLKIENVLGQIIFEKTYFEIDKTEIDLNNFKKGQYMIILETDEFSVKKIIFKV